MSGIGCGGALGAEARERWGSGALQRAGHGDGEVAAAELGRNGVARGGGVQEVAGVPRGAVGEAGGGLRPSSATGSAAQRRRAEKQRGREVKDEGWTGLQILKSSRVPL